MADCPRAGLLAVGGPLFMGGDASQRVLLSAKRGTEQLAGVISAESPAWAEPVRVSAWANFVRFLGEGVWHVLIGYDHVAFVLLLLLPSVLRPVNGQWQGAAGLSEVTRDIFTIITAFTVAHSITLALAVTGTVHLPTRPIEVAIAASIAVAGAVNLLPKLSRLRLPLAFGFGFVHGFGFANALSEIDASGATLLPLLAGFNIGVEIAQSVDRRAGAAGHLHGARYALVRGRRDAAGLLRAGRGGNRLAAAASLAAARGQLAGGRREDARVPVLRVLAARDHLHVDARGREAVFQHCRLHVVDGEVRAREHAVAALVRPCTGAARG
jgi:hypothetical protein